MFASRLEHHWTGRGACFPTCTIEVGCNAAPGQLFRPPLALLFLASFATNLQFSRVSFYFHFDHTELGCLVHACLRSILIVYD